MTHKTGQSTIHIFERISKNSFECFNFVSTLRYHVVAAVIPLSATQKEQNTIYIINQLQKSPTLFIGYLRSQLGIS